MSEPFADLGLGTAFLLAGTVILMNTEALAKFDVGTSNKLRAWFKSRLGEESVWNRKIYSVAEHKRLRNSKIGFRIVGGMCCLAGLVGLSVFFIDYLR